MLPSLGDPVVWPADSIPDALLGEVVEYAVGGGAGAPPAAVAQAVPIQIGSDVVGIVAAIVANGAGPGSAGDRAWLEAAAAAAAVTRLRGDGRPGDARRALLAALLGGPAVDPAAIVADSRRLGVDLSGGAIAVYARGDGEVPDELAGDADVLIGELARGQVLALVPLAGDIRSAPPARSPAGSVRSGTRPRYRLRAGNPGCSARPSARRCCSRRSPASPRRRSWARRRPTAC